jgi:SAM-dependent methyltransferase
VFLREDTHRLYHELAWVYDAIYPQIFDYRAVYDALKPVLEENHARTVLEVACGTGRLMAILESEGYEVTGLDLSPEMLALARPRVRGRLVQRDMRKLGFSEEFDVVLCLGSSFTYMSTDADALNALRGFHRALRPGGVLVFDNFNAERFDPERYRDWREIVYRVEGATITRRSRNRDWDPEGYRWVAEWEYIIERDGLTQRVTDSGALRAFTYEQLSELLCKTGLTGIQMLNSDRLTMKAEKS